ncbi:MAG: S1C family serine protease [Bryobacteraceae bacterium]
MNFETGPLASFSEAITDLIGKASSGVVVIKGSPYRASSGIALAADLIAACNHAVKRDEGITVVSSDGHEFRATVIGRLPGLDVTILKADPGILTPLPSADMSALKAGALIAAVGWTLDVGASASLGTLGAIGGPRRMWRGGTVDHFLRLDINLYPSQSGAAIVDAAARLIGLATPALSRHAAVSIPIDTLRRFGEELRSQGRIRRGYVGVAAQAVPIPAALREKTHLDVSAGLMLLSVEPDSPAERAGLQLGDILTMLDGKPIADVEELQDLLSGDAVGKTLEAVVIRGGEALRVGITIVEWLASKRRRITEN